MTARLRAIASSIPALMADALLIHVAKVAGTFEVAGFALYGRDLAVLHPAPRRAAYMARIAPGGYVQRDVVGWHASNAGMGPVVASQTVASPESRIVVPVPRAGKTCVAPHVTGLAVGYSDRRCASVDCVDSLRYSASRRV